jgi:hypothetical protein
MDRENMNSTNETIDKNASPSAYGWCFQVGAGISLILDAAHIKNFSKIKMEGKSDDIEITLNDGQKIYAQAKSVTQMGDQRNASSNLKNALAVLSGDEQNGDAFKLIYITNIGNPLSSTTPSTYSYGHNYEFSILSTKDQKKITDKTGTDFPTDKFELRIIRFFGTGDNKFQSIKQQIEEFLREAINDPSCSKLLLDRWFQTFMVNAADIPDNEKEVDLKKKDVIFPVIAVVINQPISEANFNEICDYENYDEVKQEFTRMIYEATCDYQFITNVLADYREKKKYATDKANYKFEFTKNEWQNYQEDFARITNSEKREAVIKIIILTIITHISIIQQIKDAAGL